MVKKRRAGPASKTGGKRARDAESQQREVEQESTSTSVSGEQPTRRKTILYRCRYCTYQGTSRDDLIAHKREHHPDEVTIISSRGPASVPDRSQFQAPKGRPPKRATRGQAAADEARGSRENEEDQPRARRTTGGKSPRRPPTRNPMPLPIGQEDEEGNVATNPKHPGA